MKEDKGRMRWQRALVREQEDVEDDDDEEEEVEEEVVEGDIDWGSWRMKTR